MLPPLALDDPIPLDAGGIAPVPLTLQLADFLVSDPVQKISFDFGGFRVTPGDFCELAGKVLLPHRPVRVSVDPERLAAVNAVAGYDNLNNTFVFRAATIFHETKGRGDAMHEIVHAIADMRAHNTGRLEEESASFLAEYLYYIVAGVDLDELGWEPDEKIMKVARAVADRLGETDGPVQLTLRERVRVRRRVRRFGYRIGIERNQDGIL